MPQERRSSKRRNEWRKEAVLPLWVSPVTAVLKQGKEASGEETRHAMPDRPRKHVVSLGLPPPLSSAPRCPLIHVLQPPVAYHGCDGAGSADCVRDCRNETKQRAAGRLA